MTVVDDAVIRKINLIEVFLDDAEEHGVPVKEPPEHAAKQWSENQIRAYFASGGRDVPTKQTPTLSAAELQAAFPAPPAADFQKWFPGLPASKTATDAPRWRVLCFPNAGNAEDMYTNEGTGVRRAPSPLLDWCRANQAECLAVQPPGRNMRKSEAPITTAAALAAQLLPIVASRLISVPYIIVAHSVGTWVAFELLTMARKLGLPMPHMAFLSAMASPDIPPAERPWSPQRTLSEGAFQEECRDWDVNEIVFSRAMWPTYQPLMRADFTLFDEYDFEHAGAEPFGFPVAAYWGSRDRKITEKMVSGWGAFTSGAFTLERIEGHHLWPLDKESKCVWLQLIAERLEKLQA